MSVILELAPPEVCRMAREVMEQHHPELCLSPASPGHQAEHVRLCLFMATDGSGEGEPAVKGPGGYPAQAVVSVIPYKQRVDKRADAEIVIDAKNWVDLNDCQRRALLDHEIEHLEFVKDKDGCVKTDDIGRPKLSLRLHDFQLGGFRSIALRHGADAPEVRLARDFEEKFGSDVLRAEGALL